jgi:hypothetical protein
MDRIVNSCCIAAWKGFLGANLEYLTDEQRHAVANLRVDAKTTTQ